MTGPALVGRPLLFYWPTDDWVHGTVACVVVPRGTRMS